MDIYYAILKGVIQGLTEFLPVSSSGHLVLVHLIAEKLGWESALTQSPFAEEVFDVLLHMGTLLALILYFRVEVKQILLAMGRVLSGKQPLRLAADSSEVSGAFPSIVENWQTLPWMLLFSTAMTVVLVVVADKGSTLLFGKLGWSTETVTNLPEFYHQHPPFVAYHLIITGLLLWLVESGTRVSTEHLHKRHFGIPQALAIGAFQSIAAVFRGVSRSGSTIAGGMICGLSRVEATRYSFLLSILTFSAAAVYEGLKVLQHDMEGNLDWFGMGVGTLVSAVVGYFCVKYFLQFVAKQSLRVFSWYCWTVGALVLIWTLN